MDTDFFIVAANCLIDLAAYSTVYPDITRCDSPKVGHVKLNGVTAWLASWCGSYGNIRGVSTLLVDPFNCSVQEHRHFDTSDPASGAATQLSNYLQLLNHGSVVVGVTGDDPSFSLRNALPTLRQHGVDVSDVQFRGSFGFIVQKGFPHKTVLRKVLTWQKSNTNPAQFNATITGTA